MSGAVVDDIGRTLVDIERGQFSVTVTACGTNDLCKGRKADDVSDALLSLARFLLRFKGVERVVLCHRKIVNIQITTTETFGTGTRMIRSPCRLPQSPSPLSKVRHHILDHYGDTRLLHLVHWHPDDPKSLQPPGDCTSKRQPRHIYDCALCVHHFLDVLHRQEQEPGGTTTALTYQGVRFMPIPGDVFPV